MSEQQVEGAQGVRSGRGRTLVVAGALLTIVAAAGAAVVLTKPWEPTCGHDDAHVVDQEAKVCYQIPEGWRQESADEIANAASLGRPGGTSVVSPKAEPEDDEPQAWVWAVEFAYADQEPDGDAVRKTFARIKADGRDPKDESSVEQVAKALAGIQVPGGSVDVDVHRVDGVPVASATASGPAQWNGADGYAWVRVTVAPGKTGYAFLLSVTGGSSKAEVSDAVVEDYNQVHDSVVPLG